MIQHVEIVLGLLAVVAGLALLAHAIKVPDSIVLVVAGLALGWIPGLPKSPFPPDIFLLFILPTLIYPSAVQLPWRDFRANLRSISLLAVGLVLLTMVGVGVIAHATIKDLPWAAAFVLGAIVSPTDPIAATAIARRMKVPRRIEQVLEGESLVNDSTGLVSYRLAMAAVVGGSFSYGHAAFEFVKMAGGGVVWGLAVGWGVVQIQRRIDNPPIETTISLLTPFAAYLPAERLGISGVLAVVATGLFVGWNSPLIHKFQTRLQTVPFWEMVQFLLNGIVFLLIGLELPEIIQGIRDASVGTLTGEAIVISAAVIAIRIAWVFPGAYLPHLFFPSLRQRDPFPDWEHVALVAWTGMRGAVSLAAALALPRFTQDGQPFPGRPAIQFLTYAVIVATLVVQGLTLPWVIRRLKIKSGDELEREECEARIKISQAGLAWIDSLQGKEAPEVLEPLQAEYSDRIRQLELSEKVENSEASPAAAAAGRRLKMEVLELQRRKLLELRNQHVINDEVLRRIQHDLDLAEERLQHQ